jgi:hypothetical protein
MLSADCRDTISEFALVRASVSSGHIKKLGRSTFLKYLWSALTAGKGMSLTNRLNDIVPLLSDVLLDESEKQMKKTSKTIIMETTPAKCNI